MSVNAIVQTAQSIGATNTRAIMEVAAVKRQLSQQELEGQAALKLMEAAAVPIDPNIGSNIDIKI